MSHRTCSQTLLDWPIDTDASPDSWISDEPFQEPIDPGASGHRHDLTLSDDGADDSTESHAGRDDAPAISMTDFYAHMPTHTYLHIPTRAFWPAASVNGRLPRMPKLDDHGRQVRDKKGRPVTITPASWLDENRPIEQVTWAPGEPELIENRIVAEGGWVEGQGCAVFNLYRPARQLLGNPALAGPWLNHVKLLYGADAEHLILWLAHRVQRPGEKVNHAIVLGGSQGIGKDTILEPVKHGVGPWNTSEISPRDLLGQFTPYLKSVLLRVSEARDLGAIDRYAFYETTKVLIAAPPDVLQVNEKNVRQYYIPNVVGVAITSNHIDGLYLPPDDRRHYVAWSDLTKDDFSKAYWERIWTWFENGGIGHVAAYLRTINLRIFNAKAPPPKTAAFHRMVEVGTAPEDEDLRDAVEAIGHPEALTLEQLKEVATPEFRDWLNDRHSRRKIPARLQEAGYVSVRSPSSKDGRWKVAGKNQVFYALRELSVGEQLRAAERLAERLRP